MRELFPQKMETKNALLRKIKIDDAMGWKSFNNAISKKMAWPIVPSVVYARNEILNYLSLWEKGKEYVYIVIDSKGEIVGDFHVKIQGKKAEIGHALHPDTWGTGLTYELLDAVKTAARKAGVLLWGKVEEENVRSWRSLEKYGATFIEARSFTINKQKRRMRVYELR